MNRLEFNCTYAIIDEIRLLINPFPISFTILPDQVRFITQIEVAAVETCPKKFGMTKMKHLSSWGLRWAFVVYLGLLLFFPKNTFSQCLGSIELTVLPTPEVEILGDDFICFGTSTILTAEGPFSTYLWSTGETTPAITVSAEGTYSVTVRNSPSS